MTDRRPTRDLPHASPEAMPDRPSDQTGAGVEKMRPAEERGEATETNDQPRRGVPPARRIPTEPSLRAALRSVSMNANEGDQDLPSANDDTRDPKGGVVPTARPRGRLAFGRRAMAPSEASQRLQPVSEDVSRGVAPAPRPQVVVIGDTDRLSAPVSRNAAAHALWARIGAVMRQEYAPPASMVDRLMMAVRLHPSYEHRVRGGSLQDRLLRAWSTSTGWRTPAVTLATIVLLASGAVREIALHRVVDVPVTLTVPGAASVRIAGDFNHWDLVTAPHLERLPLSERWAGTLPLRPGRYRVRAYVGDPGTPGAWWDAGESRDQRPDLAAGVGLIEVFDDGSAPRVRFPIITPTSRDTTTTVRTPLDSDVSYRPSVGDGGPRASLAPSPSAIRSDVRTGARP